ncbi:unnamed protein product [Spirodela intermedia]|uniref:LOB domain-containing protein n=1 Tax=Spirodela intermedia TaxID=51605 RepID=A0A7I8IUK6_SPIIN|nr:unnamed protein product [Spirodela intermedia]CAA6661290.1 unnamed protein product [Spirodela intermedia]
MRMSCNGCRVLRKGCSENCSIRPCLQWISSPESQGNATVFLAKFYGRAGLMNLINEGPENLRPAIFRSLLYEACGRIVNPIYGSVGLLWSGSWHLCQAAVDAVLKGAPILQISSDSATSAPAPPFIKASSFDIRHVAKDHNSHGYDLHKVNKATRPRFKRSANPSQIHRDGGGAVFSATGKPNFDLPRTGDSQFRRMRSEESFASQTSASGDEAEDDAGDGESREHDSAFSAPTSMVTSHSLDSGKADDGEVELELTLGFEPVHHSPHNSSSSSSSHSPRRSSGHRAPAAPASTSCRVGGVDLGLHLPL